MKTSTPCRIGCGACCIAPSISSPIPGMPFGKPAGVRCIQLDDHNACRIFGQAGRPAVCASLQATPAMCGDNRAHALSHLASLELLTQPEFPLTMLPAGLTLSPPQAATEPP